MPREQSILPPPTGLHATGDGLATPVCLQWRSPEKSSAVVRSYRIFCGETDEAMKVIVADTGTKQTRFALQRLLRPGPAYYAVAVLGTDARDRPVKSLPSEAVLVTVGHGGARVAHGVARGAWSRSREHKEQGSREHKEQVSREPKERGTCGEQLNRSSASATGAPAVCAPAAGAPSAVAEPSGEIGAEIARLDRILKDWEIEFEQRWARVPNAYEKDASTLYRTLQRKRQVLKRERRHCVIFQKRGRMERSKRERRIEQGKQIRDEPNRPQAAGGSAEHANE